MYGFKIPNTNICVDYWDDEEEPQVRFLTHVHDNRLQNISNVKDTIYMTAFSLWFLKYIRKEDLEGEVVCLSLNKNHRLEGACNGDITPFYVTLIDSNHCPGSVMYLFEGEFGHVLCTGDFRFQPRMLDNPILRSLSESKSLDILNVDNRFIAEHCYFPPKEDVIRDTVQMLKAYPDHKIVLCIGHFGKYELLKAIAKELKEKIQVTSNFLMIAKRMAISNIFTLQDARITTKETEFLSEKDLHKLKSKIGPTIVLIFSPFFNTTADHENIAKFQEMGLNILPYSEHSNHKELYTFIEALRPNAIVPIIKPNAGLDPAVIRNSTIPTCIAALQRSGGRIPSQGSTFENKINVPMSLVSEMLEKCAVNGSILEEGGEPKRKRKKISPSSVAKSCSSAGKCTVNTRNLELGSPALETGYDINKEHLTKSCSITRKRTVHTRNLELRPPALETGYDINKKYLTKRSSIVGKFTVDTRNLELEIPALETGSNNNKVHLKKSSSIAGNKKDLTKSSSIVGKFTVDTRNLELEIPALETGSNNNKVHLKKSSSIAGKHMVDTRILGLGTPALETESNKNKEHLKKSSSIVGKHMVNAINLEVGTPALETEYDNNQENLAKNCSIAGKFKVVTRNLEFETPALETGYDNEQEYLAKSCSSERNVVNNTPEEFANKKDYLKMLTYWKDQGITGKTFRHPDFRGAYDYE